MLKELALNAPTFFFQQVQPFFENIPNAVRDPKVNKLLIKPFLGLDTKGPITWGGLAQLAGLAWFARISARLLNTLKINFTITWKNLSLASWDPGIAMPGSRLDRLKV